MRRGVLVAVLVSAVVVGCSGEGGGIGIRIDVGKVEGTVSPLVVGYNHLWPLGGQGIRTASPAGWDEEVVGHIRDLGVRLAHLAGAHGARRGATGP